MRLLEHGYSVRTTVRSNAGELLCQRVGKNNNCYFVGGNEFMEYSIFWWGYS